MDLSNEKLIGLDLFSGIGGITLALSPWVQPTAYCECDEYCQSILLARMADRSLPEAPIWDDVTTLDGRQFEGIVDIIYGGFPCQNISTAGRGAGLEGERSRLFLRSCAWPKKSSPVSYSLKMSRPSGRADSMLSSTNWPISGMTVGGTIYPLTTWAHRTSEKDGSSLPTKKDPTPMGLWPTPTAELTGRTVEQYQEYIEKDRNGRTKPCHLEISVQMWPTPCALDYITPKTDVALNRMMTEIRPGRNGAEPEGRPKTSGLRRSAEDENGMVGEEHGRQSQSGLGGMADGIPDRLDAVFNPEWWRQEPNIPRVTQEKERRVQRLRALGNAVVPAQAREAFRRLAGL